MPAIGDILIEMPHTSINTGHSIIRVTQTDIVHATPVVLDEPSGRVVREEDDALTEGKYVVFTCREKAVAAEAARLAIAWSDTSRKTGFSSSLTHKTSDDIVESRTLGITEANKHSEHRVFGQDALYCAFKWASNKGDKHFSRNRGTTCCPFVTACFQAAWIRYHYNFNDALISNRFNTLKLARPSKLPKEERVGVLHVITPSGTKLGRRPFPQYARFPGDLHEETMKAIAAEVEGFSKAKLQAPADLVTPGLFVDAKFNSTLNLNAMLANDAKNWSRSDMEIQ